MFTSVHKKSFPGKIVGGFCIGTQKLYEFIHDNPFVNMIDIEYINAENQIAKNPKVTAINSAIEVQYRITSFFVCNVEISGIAALLDIFVWFRCYSRST